jgi:hypothetical protein
LETGAGKFAGFKLSLLGSHLFVFAQFTIESAGGDAEDNGGAVAVAVSLSKHAEDVAAFEFFEGVGG